MPFQPVARTLSYGDFFYMVRNRSPLHRVMCKGKRVNKDGDVTMLFYGSPEDYINLELLPTTDWEISLDQKGLLHH